MEIITHNINKFLPIADKENNNWIDGQLITDGSHLLRIRDNHEDMGRIESKKDSKCISSSNVVQININFNLDSIFKGSLF